MAHNAQSPIVFINKPAQFRYIKNYIKLLSAHIIIFE